MKRFYKGILWKLELSKLKPQLLKDESVTKNDHLEKMDC